MGLRILNKVEVIAVADEKGCISYHCDLSYYAPGEFASGCEMLDLVCDVFSEIMPQEVTGGDDAGAE